MIIVDRHKNAIKKFTLGQLKAKLVPFGESHLKSRWLVESDKWIVSKKEGHAAYTVFEITPEGTIKIYELHAVKRLGLVVSIMRTGVYLVNEIISVINRYEQEEKD